MLMNLDLLAGITSDPYVTLQEIHQTHFIKLKKKKKKKKRHP